MQRRFVCATAVLVLFGCWLCAVRGDTFAKPVTSLPLMAHAMPSPTWSGYVDVTPTKSIFYVFTESMGNPDTDPLVLWLTGGPGCSGMLALFTEAGPFRITAGPNETAVAVTSNPYSWVERASIIWIESPAGVGWSYDTTGNYTSNDRMVARDNLAFLRSFVQLFPRYRGRPTYISGESYAGHYVPQLSQLIYQSIPKDEINLVGFTVGNPSTDHIFDHQSYFPFMFNHGFISPDEWLKAESLCNGSYIDPTGACKDILNAFVGNFLRINPYDVYGKCIGKGSQNGGCLTSATTMASFSTDRSAASSRGSQTFVPCIQYGFISDYMNRDDVKTALHVSSHALPEWVLCSQVLNYTDPVSSVMDIYHELQPHMHILVYSGTFDSCVNALGTSRAFEHMSSAFGWGEKLKWSEWFLEPEREQLAGYIEVRGNAWHVTVRGASHMVPATKPIAAREMMFSFWDQTYPPLTPAHT